jgi:hypothetical protein
MTETMARKAYSRPVCRQLGSVQELTQAASSTNCDVPCGSNNNDAFAPLS